MSTAIQWVVCSLLGLAALVFLLGRFGVWPWRKRKATGDCGACAHCAVKPAAPAAAAEQRIRRLPLTGPPR
jgi:hypothetical protein